MKKTEKKVIIDNLVSKINGAKHLYFVDIAGLNAEQSSDLRRKCFNNHVEILVAKNTFIIKALKAIGDDYEGILETLKGSTAIMFSEVGNTPAKIIKDFRKKSDKPELKSAYVEEAAYIGDNELDTLVAIKSKDELIADVMALLQSPTKNLISALQSGGNNITGVLKTLSQR